MGASQVGEKRRKWYLPEKSSSNCDESLGKALASVAWLGGALLRGREAVGSTPSPRVCSGGRFSLSLRFLSLPPFLKTMKEKCPWVRDKKKWGKICKNVKKQMKINEAIIHSREIKMTQEI